MTIRLISSGKTGVLTGKVNADLYIDCRGIVNPFRDSKLMAGGQDALNAWMWEKNAGYIEAAHEMVKTAYATAGTRNSFSDPNKPLTVCFFCLAGQHRSPAMKRAVYGLLKGDGLDAVMA